MIKPNELRRFNWVTVGKKAIHYIPSPDKFMIKELREDHCSFVGFSSLELYENLEPIPLTEEWLLKFGFEEFEYHIKNNLIWYKKWPLPIFYGSNGFEKYLIHDLGGRFVVLKYVHQLQNLYFALTGEELKLKQ